MAIERDVRILTAISPTSGTFPEGMHPDTSGDLVHIVGDDGPLRSYEDATVTPGVARTVQAPVLGPDYSPPLDYASIGAATTAVIRAAPANVTAIVYEHTENAFVYLQLHDKASALSGSDVPKFCWLVQPIATRLVSFTLGTEFFTTNGVYFEHGLAWGVSSTSGTYTSTGTASKHTLNLIGI
jgi:hypothetical protein